MEDNRISVGSLSTRPALIDPLLQQSLWDPKVSVHINLTEPRRTQQRRHRVYT